MNYLFVLGRDPELALLELESYFDARNIDYRILEYTREIALVSLQKIDFNKVITELGGTVKIAEVLSDSGNLSEIEHSFNKLNLYIDRKLNYFITNFNSTLDDFVKEVLKELCKKQKVKLILKKPARKFDKSLSPTEIIEKDLIKNGLDIVLYKNNIGRTIAVFNPELYKERDIGRPKTDFLKTTSLRLARILVNIAHAKENSIVLDPFSGNGTIMQEALLNGSSVIGVDIDKEAVDSSIENLNWLKNKYHIKKNFQIYNENISNLSKIIKKVDAIVTEPYMGPFLRKKPTREQAFIIIDKLRPLYTKFFEEAYKILDKNGRIVIIMPRIGGIDIDPLRLTSNFTLYRPKIAIRLPIPYILKNSIIERYIYVLEPKS